MIVNSSKVPDDNTPLEFVPNANSIPALPEGFRPPPDILVDPYDSLFCFVCRVSLPAAASNLKEHLSGRRHETANQRFKSPAHKRAVRQQVIDYVLQKRRSESKQKEVVEVIDMNDEEEIVDLEKVENIADDDIEIVTEKRVSPTVVDSDIEIVDENYKVTIDRSPPRKRPKRSFVKRMRATTIDKDSFLAVILAEVQAEEERDDAVKQRGPTHVETEGDETKIQSFAQIDLKPPPGPDFFFDSIAEETQPSEASAKIKDALKKANRLSQAALAESRKMEEGEEDDNFISVVTEEGEKPLNEEEKRAQFEELKRTLIVLKDKTGEELPPWLTNAERTEKILYAHDSSVALHYEILEFSQFLKPTQAEVIARDELIVIIQSVAKQLWPEATVTVFGSYATDLFLPASDVDLCIMGTPENGSAGEFQMLADAVRNVDGFAKRVSVIDAKVKLVKIIAKKTNMDCDICIGAGNGPKYVPVIKEYVEKYPALRPLLLVVKCFLKQRNLNEVYSGGLGSYTLLLLVVSHLQMLKHNFPNSKANLGSVLHQFFKLYGRMFNICLTGIRVKDDGGYMDKYERYKITPNETIRYSIEDPNDVDNHLGANGYGAMRVRRTFANAAKTLANWRRDDSSLAPTPLGSIIRCEELLVRRRKDVILDLESKGEQPLREMLIVDSRFGKSSSGYEDNSSKMDSQSYVGSSSRSHKRWDGGDSEYNGNGNVNADEVNERFNKRRRAGVNSYYGVNNTNMHGGYGSGNVGNSVMFNGNGTYGYAPVYPVMNPMMNSAMTGGSGQYMRQNYDTENSFHPGSRVSRRERHKPRRRAHKRDRGQ